MQLDDKLGLMFRLDLKIKFTAHLFYDLLVYF